MWDDHREQQEQRWEAERLMLESLKMSPETIEKLKERVAAAEEERERVALREQLRQEQES